MNNKFKNYKHIIWDWNGTLLDDSYTVYEVYLNLAKARGLETVSFTKLRDAFQFPVMNTYKLLGFDTEEKAFKKLVEEFHILYEEKIPSTKLHKSTVKILEILKELNINQSVLSAHPHNFLIRDVEHHGLSDYFYKVNGIDSIEGTSKVETGLKFIKTLKEDKENILYLGDTDHDFEVASKLGVKSILIANGIQNKAILEKSGADTIFDNLEEVLSSFI